MSGETAIYNPFRGSGRNNMSGMIGDIKVGYEHLHTKCGLGEAA
jgi:hypothetical protein